MKKQENKKINFKTQPNINVCRSITPLRIIHYNTIFDKMNKRNDILDEILNNKL